MATKKADKIKLFCPQGKTFRKSIKVTAGNKDANLTGYTGRIEIRTSFPNDNSTPDDNDVIHTLTTENGGISIDPEVGRVRLFIHKEITATFPVGPAFWELELTSPTGETPYLMSPSAFVVLAEITLNEPGPVDPILPDEIDGGEPDTEDFDNELDGGGI